MTKRLWSYRSNPPLFFFWHLGDLSSCLSARSHKCQKIKMVG